MTYRTSARNAEIRRLASEGERLSDLALSFGVSRQRIDQIVNPEKALARQRTLDAERLGLLHRPELCEKCGEKGPVEAHHPDYLEPLNVRYLCAHCHHREHACFCEGAPRTIRVPDAEWEQAEQYRREEGLPSRNAFFLWLLAGYRKKREREHREER